MKPIPASARQRSTPAASRSIFTPSASRRSAEPQWLEAARLPCLATGTPAPATTIAESVEMLNVPLRSPPVPQVSSTGAGGETRVRELERRAGEAVELVDGLAFRSQGHQESTDLPGSHVARHDRPHRRGGLLGRQRLVRDEALQRARPEVGVGLAHEGPHASSCAWLEPCGAGLHCRLAASGGGPTRVWFNGRTQASQARNGGSIPLTRSDRSGNHRVDPEVASSGPRRAWHGGTETHGVGTNDIEREGDRARAAPRSSREDHGHGVQGGVTSSRS